MLGIRQVGEHQAGRRAERDEQPAAFSRPEERRHLLRQVAAHQCQPECPQLVAWGRAIKNQHASGRVRRFGVRTGRNEREESVGRRPGQPAHGCAKVRAARPGQKRIDVRHPDGQPWTGRQGVDLGHQLRQVKCVRGPSQPDTCRAEGCEPQGKKRAARVRRLVDSRENHHRESPAKRVCAGRKSPDERLSAGRGRQQEARRLCGQLKALQVLYSFLQPAVEAGPQERTGVDSDEVALGGNLPVEPHGPGRSRRYLRHAAASGVMLR